MTKKRIFLNAFDMHCAGHQSPGVWTHPEDQSDRFNDLSYWTDLAKMLEAGGFDGIFFADVLGTYDVYNGSREAAVTNGVQVPVNDPLLAISAMAHVTEHLGFGVTYSVTYEHPYILARRLSTLDHLTNGRIGWNIVTSYLDSAAVNLGFSGQLHHDQRYEIAEEYLEVCYKLWEGSWEEDAVVKDKKSKVYTDHSKVHNIRHEGKHFTVPGPHLCEPSPQRTPVLYQAGASPRGRQFASKHAECVFTAGPTIEIVKDYVKDLRSRVSTQGRNEEDVRVFGILTPIVGKTEDEAQAKYETIRKHVSYEGSLALLSGWTGIDLSQYSPDESLKHVTSNAMQSAVDIFTKADPNRTWTLRELAYHVGVGGRGPVIVGTPQQVADEMERWVNEADVDGFNIPYTMAPGSFQDFTELVVPELRKRGLLPPQDARYETYRENLFGEGKTRLPSSHPSHTWKELKRRTVT
ncbi:5,10-methylene tetrahydromethanopterin reductase [Alteribacter lacisalsi]|uniref:5,10-methylene tetrahydromethanopterin reductase n=1 Tax=Alteribacter lacisalsi TaxID=2045244 RepID=A0A2W0H4J7_9BACI|nr:LLM class flavin-dependent oxidoreductase [Alteribacter lacisalsi]PYZ96754.1 5,10-methylene tetrahydromethanopterin reductase [Alteribacter lacisalsi]